MVKIGNYLAVQRLGLCNTTAEGTVSIPGWGTNISQNVSGLIKKNNKVTMGNFVLYILPQFFFFLMLPTIATTNRQPNMSYGALKGLP